MGFMRLEGYFSVRFGMHEESQIVGWDEALALCKLLGIIRLQPRSSRPVHGARTEEIGDPLLPRGGTFVVARVTGTKQSPLATLIWLPPGACSCPILTCFGGLR